jgi:hypothetical protein
MQDKFLRVARKIVTKIGFKQAYSQPSFKGYSQIASDLIKEKLEGVSPCMIARFGSGELSCVSQYRNANLGFGRYFSYVMGKIDTYEINQKNFQKPFFNAGIFPVNKNVLSKFSELMLQDMKEVDILGSWLDNEKHFDYELANATKVSLPDLEPYYHNNPWSACLKGKDILVIHPFSNTISEQYKKRTKIFKNQEILPEFNLKTIKAVQSIAGEETNFADWFEALDYMKNLINETQFDIAIIGCGAYGFPLAAHIKRMGKKSVHLGGATQVLFGIRGSRWDSRSFISELYNENWVYPNRIETPLRHKDIENGCYW